MHFRGFQEGRFKIFRGIPARVPAGHRGVQGVSTDSSGTQGRLRGSQRRLHASQGILKKYLEVSGALQGVSARMLIKATDTLQTPFKLGTPFF